MPPKWGPCGAASGWRKSPKGRAQDAREGAARTWMCAQRPPEPAREPGGQDARKARYLGCVSFGDFSLHKQRKVTRSPAGRVEALHFKTNTRSKELDSGVRRNDEQ